MQYQEGKKAGEKRNINLNMFNHPILERIYFHRIFLVIFYDFWVHEKQRFFPEEGG